MYLYLNTLSSHHNLNSELIKNYQKGYNVDSIGRFFIRLDKNPSGLKYYINLSSKIPSKGAKRIRSINGFYSYFTPQMEHLDKTTLKEYSQNILYSYRNKTYAIALIIFLLIATTYVLPSLSVLLSISSIIFLIALSFRSVNQRKFFYKIYLPFLKENHFLDEYYENRFLINTPSLLNNTSMTILSEKGKISILNNTQDTNNYMMVTLLQREEVIELFKRNNIIFKDIRSIVKR